MNLATPPDGNQDPDRVGSVAHTIVLTGPPGAGKTTVGRLLAEQLDRAFIDLDAVVEAAAGMTIAEIFAAEGEPGFRARERAAALQLVPGGPPRVIATGGGALADPAIRAHLESVGTIVCLTANVATLAARLRSAPARPLLPDPTPDALADLLARRRAVYDAIPLQVDTARRTTTAAASHCLALGRLTDAHHWSALPVQTPAGGYRVLIGTGVCAQLGRLLAAQGLDGPTLLVSDSTVARLYSAPLLSALAAAGLSPTLGRMPVGERAKSLRTVARLYDACAAAGLGRDGTVVGLGGGVVTDTAGFTAATWLRGLPYVAVPTTLLGMVDAAIGGKTGVNHPTGKNLVGAFHHPMLVAVDPLALATLPRQVLVDGLAEVLKAGLVGDPTLLDDLGRDGAPPVQDLARWSELIRRSVGVKAAIVSADPAETGRRIHLNLGHTFAHALELASGYRLSHGRAVAIGLVAAARLGERMGHTEPGLADRVAAVLQRVGLPVSCEGMSVDDVLAAMRLDKKRVAGSLRFVVPFAPGKVQVVEGVDEQVLREVVAERVMSRGKRRL